MKVLVAEDDPFLAKIYRMNLEQEGFEATVVGNGELALEAAKKDPPDIILLDIMMPKMDGFAALEQLKKDATLKDIPVLVLSNLGQESDVKKGKEFGAVDFIIKGNVDVDEVTEKIKKYVEN
jgi:DNA-binding response OmpR family regulator